MLISVFDISKTAVSGEWSVNTPKFYGGALMVQLVVEATTTTTTFDITITDDRGNTVYSKEGITGSLNDYNVWLPLKGIYTITCSNSTTEEAFTGRLLYQED